jgi:hypothetical protein
MFTLVISSSCILIHVIKLMVLHVLPEAVWLMKWVWFRRMQVTFEVVQKTWPIEWLVYLETVAYSKHQVLTLTATAGFPEVMNEYKDYTTKYETAPYYQMEIWNTYINENHTQICCYELKLKYTHAPCKPRDMFPSTCAFLRIWNHHLFKGVYDYGDPVEQQWQISLLCIPPGWGCRGVYHVANSLGFV